MEYSCLAYSAPPCRRRRRVNVSDPARSSSPEGDRIYHLMVKCLCPLTVDSGWTRVAGAILGRRLLVHLPRVVPASATFYRQHRMRRDDAGRDHRLRPTASSVSSIAIRVEGQKGGRRLRLAPKRTSGYRGDAYLRRSTGRKDSAGSKREYTPGLRLASGEIHRPRGLPTARARRNDRQTSCSGFVGDSGKVVRLQPARRSSGCGRIEYAQRSGVRADLPGRPSRAGRRTRSRPSGSPPAAPRTLHDCRSAPGGPPQGAAPAEANGTSCSVAGSSPTPPPRAVSELPVGTRRPAASRWRARTRLEPGPPSFLRRTSPPPGSQRRATRLSRCAATAKGRLCHYRRRA